MISIRLLGVLCRLQPTHDLRIVLPFLNNEDKQKLDRITEQNNRIIDTNIQLSSALPLSP